MSVLIDSPSFGQLLYRYWFFDWLFRDASRGTAWQRETALRFNRSQAHWLLVYVRRWSTVIVVTAMTGTALELIGLDMAAAALFVSACVSFSVIVVALAGWLGLRLI